MKPILFLMILLVSIWASGKDVEAQMPTESAFEAYTKKIPGTEVAFEMLPIPDGDFLMGSPEAEPGRKADEGPQVRVSVDAFWMGKHEVSWGEYQQFMKLCVIFGKFNDLKIRQPSADNQIDAVTAPSQLYDPSFVYQSGDDVSLPAVAMSQYGAKQYTKWLSLLTGEFYRLPTEAEWEYACRAGTTTAFSFGDEEKLLEAHGCFIDNSDDETSKVGSRKPNAWGLFDMHGNVSEWVLDQYHADWFGRTKKDLTSSVDAIAWPKKLFPRVLRGGSWDSDAEDCRSAARRPSDDDQWRSYDPNSPQSPWWFASDQGQTIGFRIVRPLKAPPREQWAKYHDADLEQIRDHVRQRIDDEGRGEWGIVDPSLPAAIEKLK